MSIWKSKKCLFSVGPMRSYLDQIRYIQNMSSGEFGLALSKNASASGADVHVVLGPVDSKVRNSFNEKSMTPYESFEQYVECLEPLFEKCDYFFSLSAVLDFTFIPFQGKIERTQEKIQINTKPTFDVVQRLAEKRKNQKIIAFAAEVPLNSDTASILPRAQHKLQKKNCDALVANPVTPNLGPSKSEHEAWLLTHSKAPVHITRGSKIIVAKNLWQILTSWAENHP